MKKLFILFLGFMIITPGLFAQKAETLEELADRIAEKAERLAEKMEKEAERLEYFAEKNAPMMEAKAERIAKKFEEAWNRNREMRFKKSPSPRVLMTPEKAILGIEASEISIEKARLLGFENPYGSYVTRVIENSAAHSAGLQPFDYIYGAGDRYTTESRDLSRLLDGYDPDDRVALHIVRNGQPMTIHVRLGNADDHDWGFENTAPKAFLGISPQDDEREADLNGVAVGVVESSPAVEMGLKDGDRITRINGHPILDWDDVMTAISNAKPGDEITVGFLRNGQQMQGKGTLNAKSEDFPAIYNGDWNMDFDWDEMGLVELPDFDDDSFDWEGQGSDRAFIGIHVEEMSVQKAEKLGFDNPYGSYVSGIVKNSAAEKAGIKPLDYIFGIDEYRVGENQKIGGILTKYKPGDKATLHLVRKGKKVTTPITFGKPMTDEKPSRNKCETPFLGIVHEGNVNEGVKIKPVKDATSEELGLKDGDVITHINGHKMVDWTDISIAIAMLNPGNEIKVEFLRDGKKLHAAKPIRSYAETKKCEDCTCGQKENVIVKIDVPTKMEFRWKDEVVKADAAEGTSPRIPVSAARAELDSPSASEESSLRAKGIDLPQSNTLAVEKLRLTPNQATGMFDLQFNLPSNGKTVVIVYNVAGRAIYEYDLGRFSGEFSDSVDIAQNGPGSYFLHVAQDERVFVKKIVLSGK